MKPLYQKKTETIKKELRAIKKDIDWFEDFVDSLRCNEIFDHKKQKMRKLTKSEMVKKPMFIKNNRKIISDLNVEKKILTRELEERGWQL
jgi:hypothetical protein